MEASHSSGYGHHGGKGLSKGICPPCSGSAIREALTTCCVHSNTPFHHHHIRKRDDWRAVYQLSMLHATWTDSPLVQFIPCLCLPARGLGVVILSQPEGERNGIWISMRDPNYIKSSDWEWLIGIHKSIEGGIFPSLTSCSKTWHNQW